MSTTTPDLDYQAHHFGDPLDGSSVGPELPRDTALDIFRDAMRVTPFPLALTRQAVEAWALIVFRAFLEEWHEQENDPGSCSRGDEAALEVLHLCTQNPKREIALRAWCMLFVLERTNKTETQIGRMLGYTKANVSAVVKSLQRDLKLRKARSMKSDQAVDAYRTRAKAVHQRNKPTTSCQTKSTNQHSRLSTLRSALMPTLAPVS